jgi:hypothetical protein
MDFPQMDLSNSMLPFKMQMPEAVKRSLSLPFIHHNRFIIDLSMSPFPLAIGIHVLSGIWS